MSQYIEFEDIHVGDTIKASMEEFGVTVERTGTVAYKGGGLRTNDHGNIFRDNWLGDWRFELLNRPKPLLPTEAGTIIYAHVPVDGGFVPLILREGKWWYLDGDSFYGPGVVEAFPWQLAKVVTA